MDQQATNQVKKNKVENLVVICPHCGDPVLIEQLNCCIFRHGILKSTGEQIHAHAVKSLCDFYIECKLIYGCGKPFKVILEEEEEKEKEQKWVAVVCDYI